MILQHFAEGGRSALEKKERLPDYGDISLKDSNQDKGGKVFGLLIGAAILARLMARPEAAKLCLEQAGLALLICWNCKLSLPSWDFTLQGVFP